ncbi:MAG: hypothetical protein QOJ89_331, partial [bacterium]
MAAHAGPETTHVALCGAFAVEIDGRQLGADIRGRKLRLLFAYLALHRDRSVRREELVEALWPGAPPAAPDDALNTLVSRLRKVLGHDIVAGRSQLRLALPAGATVDVELAFEAIERAERAVGRGAWEEASDAAERALRVAERGFLAEADAAWAEDERRRLDELLLRALECLAACGLGVGGSQLSVTERAARRLIGLAPYRETGHRYLMQALAERGRVADALRVFDDVRRILRDELGTPPSPGLRALHERLLSEHALEPRRDDDDPLAVSSATLTALFTDLVCPADTSPALADELRRAHLRLVGQAVAAHGGQVREARHGSAAVFQRARDGLACAIRLQQAAERHNRRQPARQLAVRAGLHSGTPVRSDDAFASMPLELAQGLCERAQPGRILASALLRSLTEHASDGLRDAPSFTPPGAAQPMSVVEVRWEPAALAPFALPPALTSRDHPRFVGREAHLDRLWRLYQQTRSGARRVAVVRGEPGIGKTRLACELALRAHADGAVVLHGRCDEQPLLAHQPFVEALRHYVSCCPLAELAGQLGPGSGELRRLVPELAIRLPGLAQPLAGDREGERHRLFESVGAILGEASDERPVVLVLDDLQWADAATLLLLRHVARHPRPRSLLVLGTYREGDVEPGHPLAARLSELGRDPGVERLSLGSLDLAAVRALVAAHAGDGGALELAETLFTETEGNPFFIVEMLRHLAESGGRDSPRGASIPEGITEVIAERVDRLGETTRRVLVIASILGQDFDFELLAHISGLDPDELAETLERALRARVVEEPAGAAGLYSFTHALIRQTIYGGLTATRRALLHRRAAASLEAIHAADLDAHLAELAHHLAEGRSAGDVGKAIDYCTRAGDSAIAQLAYEQAATHYRQAVSLVGAQGPGAAPARRCDLVIAQGEAERQAGDPAYRET